MARSSSPRKRKAVTKDVEDGPAIVSGDELDLDASIAGRDILDDEGEPGHESDSESNYGFADGGASDSEPFEGDEVLSLVDPSDAVQKGIANGAPPAARNSPEDGDVEEEEEGEEKPNFRIEQDANGNDRYVYDEIDVDDDSEDSALGEEENTIGNIPLSFYDSYPHIGYNINGKKISRPATGKALDALLHTIEVPQGWTGLTDPQTGKPLELNPEELELLRRVQMNEVAEYGYDPYEPMVEWFTSKVETMPLSAAPEPKRRFVPSKHEAKRVMKIVRAIREGRILPYKPPDEQQDEEEGVQKYDIWADEKPRPDHAMHMPAPKLAPPGFDESYHPPPEYLPDKEERKAWEEADDEDKQKEYLPTDHSSLRKVPGYGKFVKEKFERCLDLYLAPRVRRSKLNIDPESLLPKLPDPNELKPFPSTCATVFRGHAGRVRSLAIDPLGLWLATGGDDGHVRVWELLSGRQVWNVSVDTDGPVHVVRWRPTNDTHILAASAGDSIYFCVPSKCDPELESASREILNAGWGYATSSGASKPSQSPNLQWRRPSTTDSDSGMQVVIPIGHTAKSISFHRRGDYLVTVSPSPSVSSSAAISIHTISKHLTQYPFRKRLKGGGPPQTAHFHPSKPILFVANQRVIRAYDLSRQTLLKIIQPGARWISSFDIHPTSATVSGSDNLIVGSYDRRLLWHDLDLSVRPYKTLRYHPKAIRAVKFHPGRYPLFADASDDGTVQVFHGEVVGDLMSNARIVPLKVLKGHRTVGELGVLDLDWHPFQPWLVSASGDGTCRLWT